MIVTKTIISCKSGWKKLYQPIIDFVVEHDLKTPQAKIGIEKIYDYFGTLKVKLIDQNNAPKELKEKLDVISKQSIYVCSYCGSETNVGTTLNNEWVTCCEDCWTKNVKSKYSNSKWKKIK